MKKSSVTGLLAGMIFLLISGSAWCEEILGGGLKLPGHVQGTGYDFMVTDSEYLNVIISSSEIIYIEIESVPEIIHLRIEGAPQTASSQMTISGLMPLTTYYMYHDDFHDLTVFTTDEDGTFSYLQDISQPHNVFIQPRRSTIFISDNATGGDCSVIGTWYAASKTCVLAMDLNETVQIDSNDITFDGDGHTVTGYDTGVGVNVKDKTRVIIKNLTVEHFWTGIHLSHTTDSIVMGNTLIDNRNNINLNSGSTFNTVEGNNVSSTTTSNYNTGLFIHTSQNNLVTGNSFSGGVLGFSTYESSQNTFTKNDIFANKYGAQLGVWCPYPGITDKCRDNEIYNNNFTDNTRQIIFYITYWHSLNTECTDNIFNLDSPVGGNYWSNFDTPAEECFDADNDRFCDSPFLIPGNVSYDFAGDQDNLPWTTPNGWELPTDTTPPVITIAVSPARNASGWHNSDVNVNFTCTDSSSGVVDSFHDVTLASEGMDQSAQWTCMDNAGNSAVGLINGINIDKTRPTVAITGITDGTTYILGSVPVAGYTSADNLSGIAGHSANLTGGSAEGVGTYTYTVTAMDLAGNQTTVSANYHVAYNFGGFHKPLSVDRQFKLGRTIPVKFHLTDANGNYISTAIATITLQRYFNNEPYGDPVDPVSKNTSDNTFRYSVTDNQYIYNLSTRTLVAGTWQLRVTVNDGAVQTMLISLKK